MVRIGFNVQMVIVFTLVGYVMEALTALVEMPVMNKTVLKLFYLVERIGFNVQMVIVSTLVGDVMDTLTAWVEMPVMSKTVLKIRWFLHLHSVAQMNSGMCNSNISRQV